MALFGLSIFSIYSNHNNGVKLNKRSCLKKLHFIDLVCSLPIVTIAIGVRYNDSSRITNWNFLDLVRLINVLSMSTIVEEVGSKSVIIWT